MKGICEQDETDKLRSMVKVLLEEPIDDMDLERLKYYLSLPRRFTTCEADRIYSIDGQVKRQKNRQARAISL